MVIKRVELEDADREQFAKIKVDPAEIADDFYDYSKVVVKKPWGYEYLIFQNKNVAVWILYLKPGAKTSMHCHTGKKTSLVVLEGEVICSSLRENTKRSAGQGLMISKGAFHQTSASSERGVFVMEIESPVNKRDLVRLKDAYGRVGEGYETVDKYSFTPNYNYLSLSEPEVYYNVTKRFGKCTITLKKLRSKKDIDEILTLDSKDIISVLSGRLVNDGADVAVDVGDTTTIGDLKSVNGLKIEAELEVLVTKRVDNILKISDYVISFFKEHGVKEIFFVPGDANVHMLDSLGRNEEVNFTCNQSERVAAMAAEAYSKLTSKLGVLIISSGASGTAAIAGVANAWVDSTPLFILSGQATLDQNSDGTIRQLGNKSLEIVELVRPITKYAVKITDPATVRYHLEKAAYLATDGRPGPVWIDIPIDIQGMSIDERTLGLFKEASPKPAANNALQKQVSEVVNLLKKAERPVLLAGNGIRISGAEKDLLKLVDLLEIPTLTSRRGADLLPENHPLFFGRPGAYGQRRANFIIQNSDLLISIGSRLSIPQIGRNYKAFARAAKKVVVDIDRNELEKKTLQPDLAIQANAKDFILELAKQLTSSRYKPRFSGWLERCKIWAEKFPPCSAELYAHKNFINPYLFIDALADELKEGDAIVVDGGNVLNYAMQTFMFKQGQRMITSTGLELPGFALAGAIGASVGNGRDQVACLCEDRGFQLNVQELQTIADNKLPIKVFILKSKGRADVRRIQKEYFGGRYVGTDQEILFGSPSLAKIGEAYNFVTYEISKPEKLGEQIKKVLNAKGPAICEIQIDPEQGIAPKIVFNVKADGRWEAKPLEDMWPFLDRKILKENMIVGTFEGE